MHLQGTPSVCILRSCEITPVECSARAAFEKAAKLVAGSSTQCVSFCLIRTLVDKAIKRERARAAAAEAADWQRCFGFAAPADQELKLARIVRTASARALLCTINSLDTAGASAVHLKPNEYRASKATCEWPNHSTSFEDFFPEDKT